MANCHQRFTKKAYEVETHCGLCFPAPRHGCSVPVGNGLSGSALTWGQGHVTGIYITMANSGLIVGLKVDSAK